VTVNISRKILFHRVGWLVSELTPKKELRVEGKVEVICLVLFITVKCVIKEFARKRAKE